MCRICPSAAVHLRRRPDEGRIKHNIIYLYYSDGRGSPDDGRSAEINNTRVIVFYSFTDRACLMSNIPNGLGLYRFRSLSAKVFGRNSRGVDDRAHIT